MSNSTMTRSIKIDDQTYARLEDFREKKETYSQAVMRALQTVTDLQEQVKHYVRGE